MKENIEKVIEFLQGFNDGYTFQQCQTCFNFNEKDSCCNKEKCEELKAIEFLISDYKRLQEEFKQVDNECFRLEQKELRLEKEIEELKSDNLEYQRTQDIFDERKYCKKYLEERRAEQPNLLYPDADEIYERYYKLKAENEEWQKAYQEEKDKQFELLRENQKLQKENEE